MASKIIIPPISPHTFDVRQIDAREWFVLCSHCAVGDGDKLVCSILHEPHEEKPYLVDPSSDPWFPISRRRASTLGEAKTIARQMAAKMLGHMEYQQNRRHAKVVR